MKKFTKLIAMLLAIVMLVGIMPTAFAADSGVDEKRPVIEDFPFVDVPDNERTRLVITTVCNYGLFNGTSATTFSPYAEMNRATAVTVLHRFFKLFYQNNPNFSFSTPTTRMYFSDVPSNIWFADAVNWASACGIVNGVGNNRFNPYGPVRKEQFAVMMYRFFDYVYAIDDAPIEYNNDDYIEKYLSKHVDGSEVSPWARKAMAFCSYFGFSTFSTFGFPRYLDPHSYPQRYDLAKSTYEMIFFRSKYESEYLNQ